MPTDLLTDVDTAAIEAAREAFLATIPAEEPREAEVTLAEGEALEADASAQGTEPVAAAATEQPAVDPEQPPQSEQSEPESRGYRRLLAREAKLREEQKALEADRTALAEYRAAKERLAADPVGFLKASGLTDKQILAALVEAQHTDLGDLAPAEIRANLAAKRAERAALEAEERARSANKQVEEREAQRFISEYQAGIGQFVTTGLTEYPALAAIAASGKPVAQAMYQTAVEMAQANPTGPAPTYAAVAAQLNSQLVELASTVAPAATPTAPAAQTTPTNQAKPVLRNSSTSTQPGPAPEPKNETYEELRERIRQQAFARHGLAAR
jgi:hypothetical protein